MVPKVDVKRNSRGKWTAAAKHVDEEVEALFALACADKEGYHPLGTEFNEKREARTSARLFREWWNGVG
jgi:hypothetical protein